MRLSLLLAPLAMLVTLSACDRDRDRDNERDRRPVLSAPNANPNSNIKRNQGEED